MTTTRTYRTVVPGMELGNPSDDDSWIVRGAASPVAAVHDTYPANGRLVSRQAGSRIHLIGYADSERGAPPTAGTPLVPAVQDPPDITGPLGAEDASFTTGQAVTIANQLPSSPLLLKIESLNIPAIPSGVVIDLGSPTAGDRGAYVGFVDGELVVANGVHGALERVNADAVGLSDVTGDMYVSIDTTTGQTVVAFVDAGAAKARHIITATGTTSGSWSADTTGSFGQANGSVDIADPASVPPVLNDFTGPINSVGSRVVVPDMPNHTAGEDLFLAITVSNVGRDLGSWKPQVPSIWGNPIYAYTGNNGVYEPALYIWRLKATSASMPKPTITLGGHNQPSWHRSVALFSVTDAGVVEVEDAGSSMRNTGSLTTRLDFPAGFSGANALTMRMMSANGSSSSLNPPGTQVANNSPEPRTQAWSTGTDAYVDNWDLNSPSGVAIGITLKFKAGTIGEAGQAFNGSFTFAKVWRDTPAPDHLYEPGNYTPAIPAVPGAPATPVTAGTPGQTYEELESGAFLESVRVHLAQSRTGAGLWSARLFAIDEDTGNPVYGPKIPPTTDLAVGGVDDRFLRAQTGLNDGTLWHDIGLAGSGVGILLESVSLDDSSSFGECSIDIAEMELAFVEAPSPSITSPLDDTDMLTSTPAVGWELEEENQTGYRVRVWEADTYLASKPESGRIAYDSGRVASVTARSHQITRPLLPSTDYIVGLQVEGEPLNGRPHSSAWLTSAVRSPDAPSLPTRLVDEVSWRAYMPGIGSQDDSYDSAIFNMPETVGVVHRWEIDFTPLDLDDPGIPSIRSLMCSYAGDHFDLAIDHELGHVRLTTTSTGAAADRVDTIASDANGVPKVAPEILNRERMRLMVVWNEPADTVTFYIARQFGTFRRFGEVATGTGIVMYNGIANANLQISRQTQYFHSSDMYCHSAVWSVSGVPLAEFRPVESEGQNTWTDPRGMTWTPLGASEVQLHLDTIAVEQTLNPEAAAQDDGSVLVSAAPKFEDVGDWYMVERAKLNQIDRAISEAAGTESYRVIESNSGWENSGYWSTPEVLVAAAENTVYLEWFGHMAAPENSNNFDRIFGHERTLRFRRISNSNRLQVVLIDGSLGGSTRANLNVSTIPANDSYVEYMGVREFGIRLNWNLVSGEAIYEWSRDNGETWEHVQTITSVVAPQDKPEEIAEFFVHKYTRNDTVSGLDGYTRRVKLAYDGRTIFDLDVERDATDDTSKIIERALGSVLYNGGPPGSPTENGSPNGTYITTKGAAKTETGVLALGASDAGKFGHLLVKSEDIPSGTIGDLGDRALPFIEWWGTIRSPLNSGWRDIISMYDGISSRQLGLYAHLTSTTVRVFGFMRDVSSLSLYQLTSSVEIPIGKRIGVRLSMNLYPTEEGIVTVTEDGGNIWRRVESESLGTGRANGAPFDVRGIDGTGGIALHGVPSASYLDQPFETEAVKILDQDDGRALVDVNFARDITDKASVVARGSFVDATGTTWTLGADAQFLDIADSRRVPDSKADQLWVPIAPIRASEVSKATGTGNRIEFVDPAPPQSEPVMYRIRPITEPEPTWESVSSEWAVTPPITVVSDSWWMSSLDGSKRFAMHPVDGVSWSEARPSEVNSSIGVREYEVYQDVLKGRRMPVTVETLDDVELRSLRELLESGEEFHVTDQHGNVGVFTQVDEIPTQLISTVAPSDEVAQIGRTYSTGFTLVETGDRRDFGYGLLRP